MQPAGPSTMSSGTGWLRSSPADATARRGANQPDASTGPVPSVPPGGTATWRAPSAAAKPPRRRSPRSASEMCRRRLAASARRSAAKAAGKRADLKDIRVQRAVDRRFNRARYDADQTVAAFAAGLKDAVDLDMVQTDLADVVQQALEPA